MIQHYKSATDFRKSLEARLQNRALITGQDLQRLRKKVAFDRFLARIFIDDETPSFLLKGGYAMELRFEKARATTDIDLTYLERFKNISREEITEEVFEVLRDVSQIVMEDYFIYQIGEAQLDLENAPYGGARYPISAFLDGRLFVRFQLDVGLDVMVNKIERIKAQDWLDFCNISAPMVCMITKEQQFAEKVHAYTLPREDRINTRVKDLVDLLLLLEKGSFDLGFCKEALETVFKIRQTHSLPSVLLHPPSQWFDSFQKMGMECGFKLSLADAFERLNAFFQKVQRGTIISSL